MIAPDRLLAFAAMSLVIILIPGPAVLFAIGRALAYGRRVALISILGTTSGTYGMVAAIAFGLGSLVERSALVFTVIKFAGAAYLVYLGVQAMRGGMSVKDLGAAATVPVKPPLRSALDGFVVGVTNPKSIVFFAAVLPQFVDREAGGVPLQMLLLGLVFCVIGALSDTVYGLAAAGARAWFARSPRRLSVLGGAGGLAMIGLGVTIAATGRKD